MVREYLVPPALNVADTGKPLTQGESPEMKVLGLEWGVMAGLLQSNLGCPQVGEDAPRECSCDSVHW